VKLLRSALYAQAMVWAASGLVIAALPRWVLVDVFDQPPHPYYAYVRVAGVLALGMALLMVLVAQRLEDVWWWSWSFIITTAGLVTVAGLHAIVGRPSGSAIVLWIIFPCVNAILLAAMLLGMAKAAQEKPFA
jgi:hypothetical protein